MKIRKAKTADLDQIERIYDHIHDFEESGVVTIGWIRDVYPIRETAEKALERDDLFVGEDNSRIVATAIINRIQVPEYYDVKWKYEAADEEAWEEAPDAEEAEAEDEALPLDEAQPAKALAKAAAHAAISRSEDCRFPNHEA